MSNVVIGIIPEATNGVTGHHAFLYDLPLVGHSMDSASNSLSALIKNASPTTFKKLTEHPIRFPGLPMDDFVYLAPIL